MTRVVACAVVRDNPPGVYADDDLETLNWVLAIQLVAATPADVALGPIEIQFLPLFGD